MVIGCVDSFSEVSGKGIQKLKAHGCNVTVGVLEQECIALNKRFFTFHNKKRPYIVLKWAESADGFIYPKQPKNKTLERKPIWITNSYSRQFVHKLRAEEQAILIGTNTAITDNPKLNCRRWKGHNPVRIVIDNELKIPTDNHLFDQSIKTIVVHNKNTSTKSINTAQLIFKGIDFSASIVTQICSILYKHQIQSVIIEGGLQTLQTFIDDNLWDEAHIYKGTPILKDGIKAPLFSGKLIQTNTYKEDKHRIYHND